MIPQSKNPQGQLPQGQGPQGPASNTTEWSVSELAGALKRTLEDAFGHVRLRGEISGYRGPHASGHAYFCLKDRDARLDAVIWKTSFARLRFKPQEGLEVIATGRITTFPGKSTYQIVVEALEPAGIGALMALLEERRRKLTAEGLFASARKRAIPYLPRVIGVVTSPTGAVIRDILHRLEDRFPRHVLVWPARVQGETSAAEVACGIRGFNALEPGGPIPRPDVIIVARGGGSLEDLWGFNEEEVVRAAAESAIPLISAVGHETDWTLIDHAADIRAPTPTGAAEIAVPVRAELLAATGEWARRNAAGMRRVIEMRRRELRSTARALPSPEVLLAARRQRLDLAAARLGPGLARNARVHEKQLRDVAAKLARKAPHVLLEAARGAVTRFGERLTGARDARRTMERQRLAGLGNRLRGSRQALVQRERERIAACAGRVASLADRARNGVLASRQRRVAQVEAAGALLASLGYRSVLARGFALVRNTGGAAIASAEAVQPGQTLAIEFRDGTIRALADGTRTRRRVAGQQPGLFDA